MFLLKITTPNEFWDWSRNVLAYSLRAEPWYNNNQPYGFAGYINDFSSRIIGYATIRQIRNKQGKNNNIIVYNVQYYN